MVPGAGGNQSRGQRDEMAGDAPVTKPATGALRWKGIGKRVVCVWVKGAGIESALLSSTY